jgi:hypothetical protein
MAVIEMGWEKGKGKNREKKGLRLNRSTALFIYRAKNCKLLAVLTHAQKTKFIYKNFI